MRPSWAPFPAFFDLFDLSTHTLAPLLRNTNQDDDGGLMQVGGCDQEDGGGSRGRWPEWAGQNRSASQEGEGTRGWLQEQLLL